MDLADIFVHGIIVILDGWDVGEDNDIPSSNVETDVNGDGESALSEDHGLVPWMNDKPMEDYTHSREPVGSISSISSFLTSPRPGPEHSQTPPCRPHPTSMGRRGSVVALFIKHLCLGSVILPMGLAPQTLW